jgi:predicted metalloprotease with PDZ domain
MKKAILTTALFAILGGLALAGSGRGYMGVTVVGIGNDESGRHDRGVYISAVQPGSGAEAAGLAENDRILTLNGVQIASTPDLETVLGSSSPGQAVTITVMRDEESRTFDVVLGNQPEMAMAFSSHGDKGFARWVIEAAESTPRIGVALQPLGEQLAAYFQVTSGVLVTRVIEDSGAWQAGLQAGDVLLDVNGQSVDNVHSIQEALQDLEPGDTVDVTVQRRGDTNQFAITLSQAAEISAGEMTFNVAFGPDTDVHDPQDHGMIPRQSVDHAFGEHGEPITIRFGDVEGEDAVRHQIHQLEQQLHHLQEKLHQLQND